MQKVGRSWGWSSADLSSQSSQKGMWQIRLDAQVSQLGGWSYWLQWVWNRVCFVFPFFFLPLFFHAPLPFSSSLAELSARLWCCSRAALLASWQTQAEGKDCQGTCPLAEGGAHLPPLTAGSQKGQWLRSFSLRARSPVCSLHTVTGFQTKRLLVPADPLLLPHSRGLACRSLGLVGSAHRWAAPQRPWVGWGTWLCCPCSSSSACGLLYWLEKGYGLGRRAEVGSACVSLLWSLFYSLCLWNNRSITKHPINGTFLIWVSSRRKKMLENMLKGKLKRWVLDVA